MASDASPAPVSKAALWTGWGLTALSSAGLLMSAVMKFVKPPDFEEGFGKFGWSVDLATHLGIVEVVCTAVYLFPRTAVLGAILLTGYLGGAVATHVRIHDHFAPPIILGVLVWLGLYFRDARLRALAPWRS